MKLLLTGASGFIGTNLIDLLNNNKDVTFINLDFSAPIKKDHLQYWKKCDLLNEEQVEKIISEFKPDKCIHLAAETEIKDSIDISEAYPVNMRGSVILFNLLKKYNVSRSIIVSTQYVCGPSINLPLNHDDYWPHTDYGKSKVQMEKNARAILKPGKFIIARPTYIWGPWHFKNFNDLVRSLKKRLYVHPSGKEVVRSYGYVKNVCFQLVKLLDIEINNCDWFYVGDRPIDSYEFVNKISIALTGKGVHVLPRLFIYLMGKIGDVIKKIPINSFRYKNMITPYLTPMEKTFNVLGESPYSFNESVKDFEDWYKSNFRNELNDKKNW